jgi:hypothetical protein
MNMARSMLGWTADHAASTLRLSTTTVGVGTNMSEAPFYTTDRLCRLFV